MSGSSLCKPHCKAMIKTIQKAHHCRRSTFLGRLYKRRYSCLAKQHMNKERNSGQRLLIKWPIHVETFKIPNMSWHQGVRLIILAVKLPVWLNRCLHLLQFFMAVPSLPPFLCVFLLLRYRHTCGDTLGLEWTLIWPITLTFQIADHPKASYSECSIPSFPALWRDIQHAPPTPLIGQFSFKWACFASTHFFPHIFQGCGFYWSLSSQGCWCLDWGTQQQLVGLLMVVSPAGCSVLGFEWCQAQQLPCSPTALSEDAC